jgi:drug/metabolite transporter (DMT)-like permease
VSRRGWLLFAAMSVIWGIPYLLIKVADEQLSPAELVFWRTALAALLLVPLAAKRGELRPLLARWRWLLVYTVVEIGGPWLLLSHAETKLSSSLAGLMIAAVPLIAAVLLMIIGGGSADDRLTPRRLGGLVIGLAGVAVLVGVDVSVHNAWAAVEIGVTSIGYAAGPIIIARKLRGLPVLGVVAGSIGLTAIGYLPVGIVQLPSHVAARVAWSVVGLALICTALAFIVFFALIAEIGPARSTVITYVNPAIALLLGVALRGEKFTAGIAVGFPLTLLGCYFATSRNRPRKSAAPAAGGPASTPVPSPVAAPLTAEAGVPLAGSADC